MKVLVYTFRTFPEQEQLKKLFYSLCVLGEIKKDLEEFYTTIIKENPQLILGIAQSNKQYSFFDSKTINVFNKTKKIAQSGQEEFKLYTPNVKGSHFKIATEASTSFCNYTMYKIKLFLDKKKVNIPLAFCHVKRDDITELYEILEKTK